MEVMLGWITKAQAKEMGFTHTIRMNAIVPGYGRDFDGECECLMCHPALDWIEQNITSPLYAIVCEMCGNDPHFAIQVRDEL